VVNITSKEVHNEINWHIAAQFVQPLGHCEKVKVRIALYGLETHHRATERHLPYGITQCYLPPDTGEHAPP